MRTTVALVLTVSACAALAQATHPYEGKWIVNWTGAMGDVFEPQASAEVTIAGNGGTWRMLRARGAASCAQLDWPVEVMRATQQELRLRVHASRALQGCNDFGVIVKRASDTRLEGTRNGKPLVFERN